VDLAIIFCYLGHTKNLDDDDDDEIEWKKHDKGQSTSFFAASRSKSVTSP